MSENEVCNVQGILMEAKAAKEMPALFRKNNIFEFVSEHHLNFPGELLSKVSGENISKDENVVVYPTIDFPEPKISLASQ
ncbi:protein SSUH2 homolog [Falco peregrinus]|uniref:protein SSUH2 homolog n=1 Tax=Falco peregrinus TaxID=8954 RepID=UPI00247A3D01|nr:protein SSUH2 homolog [Falco peregrinus]